MQPEVLQTGKPHLEDFRITLPSCGGILHPRVACAVSRFFDANLENA